MAESQVAAGGFSSLLPNIQEIIHMTIPKTLLELSQADTTPARIGDSCLVLIDFQNEYLAGPIALAKAGPAITNALRLVKTAREIGAPLFHIAHKGRTGGLFDRASERGQIVSELCPAAGEILIEKGLPNSFAGTDLRSRIEATGRKNLILCGFMTHMCVSSTARAALDNGFRVTVDASSCATRDLPNGTDGIIPASTVHEVALAELADRFAIIVRSPSELI
jgi:nicotinamidase-related amidase